MTTDPRALATALCNRLESYEMDLLRDDPFEAIPLVDERVSIDMVVAIGDDGCSVEGLYHEPQRHIEVQEALSFRRTRFTALHEFGHDRARHDLDVARALAGLSATATRRVEERVADAFAAAILIPDPAVDEILDGRRPTAADVVNLFHHPSVAGSREACCVRIAQRMSGEGYVVLVEGEVLRFCAVVGNAYRLARGSSQAGVGLLRRAAIDGTATDPHVTLLFADGRPAHTYAGHAVTDDIYTFAVLTDATRPPWSGSWIGVQRWDSDAPEIFCPECDEVSEAWKRCDHDSTHRVCSNCGWCQCRDVTAKVATKKCDSCMLPKRIDLFDNNGTTCRDCT